MLWKYSKFKTFYTLRVTNKTTIPTAETTKKKRKENADVISPDTKKAKILTRNYPNK